MERPPMTADKELERTREGREPHRSAPEVGRLGWRDIKDLMTRPQPVTIPMVVLFSIIPVYLYIGHAWIPGRTLHIPELALDRLVPVVPAWSVIYGSLFLAALLPVFVVHQQELVRRTIWAFLFIWLFAYACFVAYPTVTPRPAVVAGDDFFSWASFVGISTLYTKQHYVADVIAGILLAGVAYVLLVRRYPREAVPERERRLAPALALGAAGLYGLFVAGLWFVYAFNGT